MARQSTKPIRSAEELAELRVRGKELYFSYMPFNDIARELGVSAATLADWRKKEGWETEREGIERGIIEDAFGARKLALSRITKLSVDQLERGLQHFANRIEPPTLNELEKLSVIVGNLDKILRLDMGKATENVQVQGVVQHTVEEVRARLAADPVLGFAIEAASAPKRIEAVDATFSQLPALPEDD